MTKVMELYWPDIEANQQKMEEYAQSKRKCESKLAAYQKELDVEIARLKAKHNYDALTAELDRTQAGLEKIVAEMQRDKAFLIIRTMAELFRADESMVEKIAEKLASEWDIEIHHNSNVNSGNYVSSFESYARVVCDADFWTRASIEMQGNYVMWVEEPCLSSFSTCFGVGLHESLFANVEAFMEWAERELAVLAENWAKNWVAGTAMDTNKQQALLRALQGQFASGEYDEKVGGKF